jgi:hypothetical protein
MSMQISSFIEGPGDFGFLKGFVSVFFCFVLLGGEEGIIF